ncbi:hypothetical protein [Neisseria sp. S1]|uniref:hypothetical protein n=1 Tax=Neisseria sp. S1 TaxID=3318354 RepID=UPI003A892947
MSQEIINVEQVDAGVIDVLITDGAAVPVQIETNNYFLLLPKISDTGTWIINGKDSGIRAVGRDGQSISPEVAAEINRRAEAAEDAAAAAVAAASTAAEKADAAGQSAEESNLSAVAAKQLAAAAATESQRAGVLAQSAGQSAALAAEKATAVAESAGQALDNANQAALSADVAAAKAVTAAADAQAAEQQAAGASAAAMQAAGSASTAASSAAAAEQSAAVAVDKIGALPKFTDWQSGYIPRSEFQTVPQNGQWVQINFPRPFERRPNYINIEVDIQSVSVFLQYKGNVTATGFQIGSNYAASIQGVFFSAGIIE